MRIFTLAAFLALPLAAAQRAASYSMVASSSSVTAYPFLEPTTATFVRTAEITTISSRAASGRLSTFTPSVRLATVAAATAATWQPVPNPARELVSLVGHDPARPLSLLDSQGRLVRTLAPAADAVLDLRGLATGLYVVRAGAQTRRLAIE